MHQVLAFILGGGRGPGLHPLTAMRSTPAVTIAGKYRLIDIPISNCINSGIRHIYVLTQFLSVSLHRHIANTYKFAPFSRSFVEVLAAQQTNEKADWYRGTGDALRQNLRYFEGENARDVLILSSDGLYRMNFAELIQAHRQNNADITIAAVPVHQDQVSGVGILRLDDNNRIVEMVEKPSTQAQLESVRVSKATLDQRGLAGTGKEFLANMGIYVCRREVLLDLLHTKPDAIDLVTQMIAPCIRTHKVQAHLFGGYWQDLGGSIRAFHEANLALASDSPPFDFHSPEGVIYTHMRNLPASQVMASELKHSLISDGCLIGEGTRIERCLVGQRTQIGANSVLQDTVITGANWFESNEQKVSNKAEGMPNLGIGEGCTIVRAILDKDCRIGKNVRLVNERQTREHTGDQYVIRDGIIIVPRGGVIRDGTVI